MTHKSKWLLLSPLGLIMIGAGASMVHWAGSLKDKGRPGRDWFWAGTAALVVLNAGVSVFGSGVAESVLHRLGERQGGLSPERAGQSAEGPGTGNVGLG